MAQSIEPCYAEQIMTIDTNGDIRDKGESAPRSTIDCLLAQFTHVIAGLDIVDTHNQHLVQRKRIKPLEQSMLSVAVAGHVPYSDSLSKEYVGNFLSIDYLKESVIDAVRKELGQKLALYFNIQEQDLGVPDFRLDSSSTGNAMNHLLALFTWKIPWLDSNTVQTLFEPSSESDGVLIASQDMLPDIVHRVKTDIFMYPPMRQLFEKWLIRA